jgi:hypothetical protein
VENVCVQRRDGTIEPCLEAALLAAGVSDLIETTMVQLDYSEPGWLKLSVQHLAVRDDG